MALGSLIFALNYESVCLIHRLCFSQLWIVTVWWNDQRSCIYMWNEWKWMGTVRCVCVCGVGLVFVFTLLTSYMQSAGLAFIACTQPIHWASDGVRVRIYLWIRNWLTWLKFSCDDGATHRDTSVGPFCCSPSTFFSVDTKARTRWSEANNTGADCGMGISYYAPFVDLTEGSRNERRKRVGRRNSLAVHMLFSSSNLFVICLFFFFMWFYVKHCEPPFVISSTYWWRSIAMGKFAC